MYYEINVSLKGVHFFATHKRSITSESDLRKVYPVMWAKFPESEGYQLRVTRWEEKGYGVDASKLIVKEGKVPIKKIDGVECNIDDDDLSDIDYLYVACTDDY